MGMLKTRGLGPERAFSAAYPTLHHRTYDLPRAGNARRVWFAQQIGTADAIIGLPGAPDAVIEEIGAFDSKLVVRGIHALAGEIEADFRISLAGQMGAKAEFAPAVALHQPAGAGERSRIALVAYDADPGEQARAALVDLDPILVDQSPEKLDGWLSIPEVNLGSLYDRCASAIVVGDWSGELAWARSFLPAAHDCHVAVAGSGADLLAANGLVAAEASSLPGVIREFRHDLAASGISETFSAYRQAQTIVDAILRSIAEKRATAT
jgi:hypothetical protein